MTAQTAKRLSGYEELIVLCGHYEGIDQRVLDTFVDEEISLGDFILTGGEIAAMAVVDAVARFVPGVLGSAASAHEDSFSDGLLEYPQYTRPSEFRGMRVPEILLSGDHQKIAPVSYTHLDQMQKQFIESFDKINENFRRIFPLLFGGGQAQLILEDKENALTCDIDIMAQPPGKKPRYITLLSGGERALTAIALLFAMLEMRATPFCILDEIEAALDEENLVLFANFMKTYASKTQFLVITHRRPSMEAATALYGIAMEEKGVSKVVSVNFEEVGDVYK